MASGEDLLSGHFDFPPPATTFQKSFHRFPSPGAFLILSRDQMCHRPSMTCDGDTLPRSRPSGEIWPNSLLASVAWIVRIFVSPTGYFNRLYNPISNHANASRSDQIVLGKRDPGSPDRRWLTRFTRVLTARGSKGPATGFSHQVEQLWQAARRDRATGRSGREG